MAILMIKVPKTPKRAFNKDRPASDLLKSQIKHLEWASRPAAERKPGKLRIKLPRTEGEAAARIGKLTQQVIEQSTAPTLPADIPPPSQEHAKKRSVGSLGKRVGRKKSKRRA